MDLNSIYKYLIISLILILALIIILLNRFLIKTLSLKNKCEIQLINEVNDITNEVCNLVINENDMLSDDGT